MGNRADRDAQPTQADRVLLALVLVAGGTFVLTILWLLLGSR